MSRRGWAFAGLTIAVLGLGVPAATVRYEQSLGPLDLTAATTRSPVVLDREGRLLRPFTTADGLWRLPVGHAEVDPRFLAMLQAYEDRRFIQHGGVDWRALGRAAAQWLASGHVVSGGSTLTMQVARLVEPRAERSLTAKLRQVFRAGELEARFTKTQILDQYLALAPYGGNLEGVRAASLAYFGREPKRLTLAQAALLVALPQSPEVRRPDRAPNAARAARDRVLDRVSAAGVISHADAVAAKAEPVPTARVAFPALAPHATEAALKAAPLASQRLTIDGRLQAALEALAHDAALRVGAKASVAIVAIDNATGEIRAHVGTPDYLSLDRAGALDMTQAVRSPGSALKPFIYAMAFEDGLAHPETILDDKPQRYGLYAPNNFDLTFQGQVTARRALQNSLNIPAIELLAAVGPQRFLARLRNAGAPIVLGGDQAPGLAVGLGGVGIKLMDLTRLYAGLARGGSLPDLRERLDGAPPPAAQQRISEPVSAWYIADILKGAPPPDNALAAQIAFKTGTSYGYRDAFAIGFDRRTTIGVWVGRADNGPVPGLVGRQVAAPVLFDAFARLGGDRDSIPPPPGVVMARTAAALPPPLRRLGSTVPNAAANGLKIAYPPDGAAVDLGAKLGDPGRLALKVQGGVPPLTWTVNGQPVAVDERRRESGWIPDGAGFARLSVIDATGATDSVRVRIE